MGKPDEDDDRAPKGRLIEDEADPKILFGSGRRGFSTRIVLFEGRSHRTFHAELTNTRRGTSGTARASPQHSIGDYIFREGGHQSRSEEILAKGGADPERVNACIQRVREMARNRSSAVAIRITIELPNDLPLQGKIAIAEYETNRLAESGRPAIWAIHPATRRRKRGAKPEHKQDHLHLIGPARPVIPLYGRLIVGRGKYLSDYAAIRVWREGLAAAFNTELAAHGLLGTLAPEWSAKPLRELGDDRPTRMRLSARAALRDEPDLSHPADQLALAWNDAIERGVDPREDSVVKEELERRANNRIEDRLLRDIAEQQSGIGKRTPGRATTPAEAQALPVATAPPVPLKPLSQDEIAEIELAHWRLGVELPSGWSSTPDGRATAWDRVEIYHLQIDRIFYQSGYFAPTQADGKKPPKIYLQVPEDRQRDALHMGANAEWKDKVYVSSAAPRSVIDRLLRSFPKREIDLEPSPAPAKPAAPINREHIVRAIEDSIRLGSRAPSIADPHPPKPPVQPQSVQPKQLPLKGEVPMIPKANTAPATTPAVPQPAPMAVSKEERAAATQRVAAFNDLLLLGTYSATVTRARTLDRIWSKTTQHYRETAHLRIGSSVLFQEIRKRKLPVPGGDQQTRQPRRERDLGI